MRRKNRHPAHENHERWLVSYADFITLLFAFFVVMFATSQADKGKAQQVSDSVKQAFDGPKIKSVVAAILGGTVSDKGQGNAMMRGPGGVTKPAAEKKNPQQVVELTPSYKLLAAELRKEIESGRIQISMEPRGLVISFKQAALFPSGEDAITPDAMEGIGKVAEAVNKLPNPVRLEGHTDSIPIHTPRFASNWELSAARSIALLELLAGRFGVERERLSIGGYADTAPIESNDTEGGRARNRRVDIVILNETGILAEPRKRR
ncbi:MAG: flagellar motor protein MotB [Bryobacteraceae bacterium]